jgi:hypothetical protein
VPAYTFAPTDFDLVLTIDTPQTVTDNYMSIWATPPIRNKTTSFRSQLKFMECIKSDYWDNVIFTGAWNTATGMSWPPSGETGSYSIGCLIQSININSGITSEGSLFIEVPTI